MKIKTKSKEYIWDLFLKELYELENNNKNPEYLINILSSKKIFFNNATISQVINFLLQNDYIIEIEGVSGFTHGRKFWRKSLFTSKRQSKTLIDELINNKIEGRNYLYMLSEKGRNHIVNNQTFDLEGAKEKERKSEKWKDRFIGFTTGILSATISFFIENIIN